MPARSPIPLIVPCTHPAPARTAATAAAVASPKSLWPCQCTGISSPTQPRAARTSSAAASGVTAPSVSTIAISRAPAWTASPYTRSRKLRSARVPSTPKKQTVTPLSVACDTAVTTRSISFSRLIPYALSFPSDTGDSITAARTPISSSASTSAGTARAKPQISAASPSAAIARNASTSSADTRGNPASIRSMPSESIARAIASFWSGSSATPTVCSPSRRVVSYSPTRAGASPAVPARARSFSEPVQMCSLGIIRPF